MIDEESFYVPSGAGRESVVRRIIRALDSIDDRYQWSVVIKRHKPHRTGSQNALLWALYSDILKRGGPDMEGWTKEDLHRFFLITHFGSKVNRSLGHPVHIPLRTSSKLNKQEFSDFIDSIVRYMAERGVVLELPGDRP